MLATRQQVHRSNVVRVFGDKGLVFAVFRSKRKLLDAYREPENLAASQQMKFKHSGNQLVLYEPKHR